MSIAENKELYLRFGRSVIAKGDLHAVDEFMSPDFVDHDGLPGAASGRESVKQLFGMVHTAFPDITFTVDDVIGEGDKVMVRGTARGTHLGSYMGMPPTGKPMQLTIWDVVRCANGKIVEHWGLTDALGLMQQLGAIPAPGGPGPER